MSAFGRAFQYVVLREGVFSDDPQDPGNWTGGKVGAGELKGTKYGISAAAYPHLDIRNLTLDQAESIYRTEYWSRIQGDRLPMGIGVAMFDAAVNQGVDTAIRCLQLALEVDVDGVVGPQTLAAILKYTQRELIERFQAERVLRYVQLSTFPKFGRGWIRRAIGTAIVAAT